jgi:hypothetical protein
MNRVSRQTMIVATGLVALLGTGCMTKPMQPANPDGTYCFATGKWHSRKLTCTPTPIPPESVEAEARRFEPAPRLLTVYVIRKRWGDTVNPVRLTVDGGAPVVTTPESFVRLRMRPGPHTFTAAWSEGTAELAVDGSAGDVRVVELVGSVWSWGSTYRLDHGDLADGRTRAARLRLVADVQ